MYGAIIDGKQPPAGLEWAGLVWNGLVWSGLERSGLDWSGLAWSGLGWSGMGRDGVVWPGPCADIPLRTGMLLHRFNLKRHSCFLKHFAENTLLIS